MTDDFETAVLIGNNDRGALTTRLRDRQATEYAELDDDTS